MERPDYIKEDPVCFMHAFDDTQDQALAGFFAATMAWGRRDIVLAKVEDFLSRMDHRPASFIRNFSDEDARLLDGFKHRTFKPVDLYWLIRSMQKVLLGWGSFERFWQHCYDKAQREQRELTAVFHEEYLGMHPRMPRRTHKHVSSTEKGSAAKRLYMYLRWVIRDESPVDPGIMHFMDASELMVPLDVHAARQARALGLLTRRYNDWKAVCELTETLRLLDPADPVKYDYALFGIGVRQESIPEAFLVNPQVIR